MKEAMFYELFDKNKEIIKCLLCPKECLIKKGQVGFCRARQSGSARFFLSYGSPLLLGLMVCKDTPTGTGLHLGYAIKAMVELVQASVGFIGFD